MEPGGRRNRMLVAGVVVVLAVLVAVGVVVALGNGGGDSDDAGDDRQQVRAAVDRLYAAFADYDAEGVCEQLNDSAQAQIAQGGLGSESDTCTGSLQGFLDRSKEAGGLDLTLKARVTRVTVDGDTAVASVRFGNQKGSPSGEIPLSKVDGDWKLDAVGADPSRQ